MSLLVLTSNKKEVIKESGGLESVNTQTILHKAKKHPILVIKHDSISQSISQTVFLNSNPLSFILCLPPPPFFPNSPSLYLLI